jgi:glycosyltransferase 2 family protein
VSPRAKRWLTWAVSLGLTAALLYYFLRSIDLHTVWEEIRTASSDGASLRYLLLAVLLEVLSIFLRAYRWRYMIKSVKEHIPFAPVLKATVVSFTLSRAAEVAKPFFLSRWQKLGFAPLLASVVLERGMDLLALVALWFGFLFFGTAGVALDADTTLDTLSKVSYLILGAAIPVGAVLLWLVPRRRILDRTVRRSARLARYPLILASLRLLLRFAGGLGTFQRKRDILWVYVMSLAIWGLIAGSCWAILKALVPGMPLGASILLLICASAGAVLPTPGGVGSVHAGIQFALVTFYDVAQNEAATAAILGHAIMFLPGILWGLLYVAFGRVRFTELKQAAGSKGKEGPDPEVG